MENQDKTLEELLEILRLKMSLYTRERPSGDDENPDDYQS